jgi:hypothetical protein
MSTAATPAELVELGPTKAESGKIFTYQYRYFGEISPGTDLGFSTAGQPN